jgi:hypothetical protein
VISSPYIGQAVQIWYGSKWRALCRHHGHSGTVEIVSKGKPRNHGVRLATGELVSIPAGNLRKPPFVCLSCVCSP